MPAIRSQIEPDAELMAQLEDILRSGHVTNDGPRLVGFEAALAEWLGVTDAIGVGSGSAALTLGLAALGLGPGRAVLPSFTYIATVNAVVSAGLTPVFADIDPETWTLSTESVGEQLARYDDVRAVIAVNTYGVPAELGTLAEQLAAADCKLVSDSAHGMGTEAPEGRVHPAPALHAWSLHATKVLPAVEGGVVTTRDPEVATEIRRLRRHGLAPDLRASSPGFNARMDELRAAIGHHSLQRLDGALSRRRAYVARLRRHLEANCSGRYQLQAVPEGVRPNGQNLAVLWRGSADVDAVIAALADEGVQGHRYFWPALHGLDHFQGQPSLPVTED
ncbi:MAG: DegT/DnrJ/EryC1/StrS family aminotransferase, partial [Myxococcota bacterium]|nr:DegT/DnrJ/EryC1/StrS family aminotransferase [Myxococcota bacterium]